MGPPVVVIGIRFEKARGFTEEADSHGAARTGRKGKAVCQYEGGLAHGAHHVGRGVNVLPVKRHVREPAKGLVEVHVPPPP